MVKQEELNKLEELKVDYELIEKMIRKAVKESHVRQKQELEVLIKRELDHQQTRIYKGLRKAIQNDLDGFIEKLADLVEAAIGEVN